MNNTVQSVESMHTDHRHWQSEHAAWREDNIRWRKEYEEACYIIELLDEFVQQHGRSLDDHRNAIGVSDNCMGTHEHKLAEFEQHGTVAPLEQMFDVHSKQAGQHAEQRDLHERIKRQHYAVMARLAAFRNILKDIE